MKKDKIFKIVVLAVIFIVLMGCNSSGVFHDISERANKNLQNIQQINEADKKQPPPVVSKKGYYSDVNPIAEENRPLWLKNSISVSARKLPLYFIMQKILRNTGVLAKYQTGVRKEKLVSIEYSGTVKGVLDDLMTQTNYAYEPTDSDVTWETFVTKTFNISFMPGTSTYQVGQTSSSSGSSGSSGSSSGGGNSVTATTGTLFGNDQQFTGFQGNSLSVWKDLNNTLQQLKSPEGKVAVSEATTMVTVYDHPNNVEAIGRYIEQLNKNLSKQVRLKVQVLEVDLDKEHTFGIDWHLAQQWGGQKFNLVGNLVSTANVTNSIAGSSAASTTKPVSFTFGDNSNAVLQALSSQGKVSIITEPSVVTMSNQVAEVRIATDTSYLQSVQSSVAAGGLNPVVSTTLTPGMVTDGVILYILPKIKDNQVYLQISSISSVLTSLDTINSAGAANQGTGTLNAIQVPVINEKRFNIRSLVANNATLIIGGFKQVQDTTRENKLFGLKALGGQGAQSKNVEMVILITPVILES